MFFLPCNYSASIYFFTLLICNSPLKIRKIRNVTDLIKNVSLNPWITYIYIYIYIYDIYIDVYIYNVYIYMYIYIYISVCMCVYVCVYVCIYIYMHVHVFTPVFVYVYMGFIFECIYIGTVFTIEHTCILFWSYDHVHIEKEKKFGKKIIIHA